MTILCPGIVSSMPNTLYISIATSNRAQKTETRQRIRSLGSISWINLIQHDDARSQISLPGHMYRADQGESCRLDDQQSSEIDAHMGTLADDPCSYSFVQP